VCVASTFHTRSQVCEWDHGMPIVPCEFSYDYGRCIMACPSWVFSMAFRRFGGIDTQENMPMEYKEEDGRSVESTECGKYSDDDEYF
jgi:hypothetical protein